MWSSGGWVNPERGGRQGFANMTHIGPNENGVDLAFGAYKRTLGPGSYFVSPIHRVILVDMRPRLASIPSSPVLTSDGTPIAVEARCEYRVVDAGRAVFGAPDLSGTFLTALRDSIAETISQTSAVAVPSSSGAVTESIQRVLSERTAKLGVEVGQLTVSLPGPRGPSEFAAGGPFRSTPLPE